MGADIYLESVYNRNQEKYQSLWEKQLAARDEFGKTLSNPERDLYSKVSYSIEFGEGEKPNDLPPKVKKMIKLQESLSKTFNAMNSDGYFRDSYNNSAVFFQLDLSWWRDVGPMLNKEGYLPISKAKKLVKMIKERELPNPPVFSSGFGERTLTSKELKEWYDYFTNKKVELLTLLEQSIDLKEPLRCSI